MTNHAAALEADRLTTAEFTALKANAEAAAEAALRNAFVDLSAQVMAERERARLLNQKVQAPGGQLGTVDSVGLNCDKRVVAHVRGWKSYPATYYAETLEVLDGKA
jgi:hypothetical protein